MRHRISDAFILVTYGLREKDRIVSFLTRDSGKKRGVARGTRSPRSAFAGLLEPMTEARVAYFEKEGKELVSINSLDAIRSSFPLSKNLDAGLLLSSLAESLQTFVSDSDPAEPFYRLARHAMDGLFAGAPPEVVAAYFDVWILKLSGLFPVTQECAGCGRRLASDAPLNFDGSRPGFVCSECRGAETVGLSPAASETLRTFLKSPLDPSRVYKAAAEVASVAGRARRHFLGHELKSKRVLADVRGS